MVSSEGVLPRDIGEDDNNNNETWNSFETEEAWGLGMMFPPKINSYHDPHSLFS